MSKHLITCGHGAGDSGAVGNGYREDTFNRDIMRPLIQKWASKLKNNQIDFYDINRNMYEDSKAGRGAYSVSGYASVTELHLDSASASATGGHVIIKQGLTPDSSDLAIGSLISKYVGLWGSSKPSGVFGRTDLLNMNVFASRNISYRLVEWGFISNATDVNNLLKNKDAIAKGLVEAITGEKIDGNTTQTVVTKPAESKPVQSKPATNDGWTAQSATFYCGMKLPLSKDTDPNSAAVAWLNKGDAVKYDAYKVTNGYVWIRQPRSGGGYYYLSIGKGANGRLVGEHWGTIK